MSWQDFEHFTGEYFRNKGYKVSETANGADGGIDLILFKNNEKFYVQCKHWRSQKVSVSVARELYGVMAANAVKCGFVVTAGRYTSEAISFAQGTNIRLINGNELVNQMKHYSLPVQEQKPIKNEQTLCPKCNGLMVKRIAKRGQYAGNTFLGCQNYPRCRGVINID
ncbi:MAG: hypothetical protein HAW67_05065 [Endozoicomonadaceae bacterium]|nr:hypothetical protein [Endozoicomonadaceae bacterium]